MPDLLFLYGTLLPARAPHAIASAVRRLQPAGRGTVRGHLYDLGEYPGVLLDGAATETVPGEVFAIPDAETLAQLDAYEDFRPRDPASSLFRRTKTVVTLDDGTQQTCWIYVYNRKISNPAAART